MFGLVSANMKELNKPQQERYSSIYCGICRGIRGECSNCARLGLSYDMAFLAMLLMSLYEPEEVVGNRACALHPIKPRAWVDNGYIRYCACMNVALGYYNALDDIADEGHLSARFMARVFGKDMAAIEEDLSILKNSFINAVNTLYNTNKWDNQAWPAYGTSNQEG